MRKDIIFIVKVPPPITGASMINQFLLSSTYLSQQFNVISCPISYNNNPSHFGKASLGKLVKFISFIRNLIGVLHKNKGTSVYFQITPVGFGFYRDFLICCLIKLFRRKIIFHFHSKGINKFVRRKLNYWLYNFILKDNDIILLSKKLQWEFQNLNPHKIHILANGIENIQWNANVDKKTFTIVYLGNLIQSKGIYDIITACEILKNDNYKIKLKIIGNEGDISFLELKKDLSIRNLKEEIDILGPIYNAKEKYVELASSDLMVFPTYYSKECFPLVILEAFQAAIPVISTDEGAIREIIDDGINGFIVPKNNSLAIAEKIKWAFNNRIELQHMSNAARKKYLTFYTMETFEKNIASILSDFINADV